MSSMKIAFAVIAFSLLGLVACERRGTQTQARSPQPFVHTESIPATAPPTSQPVAPAATTQPTGAATPQALMAEVIPLLRQKQYEHVFRRYFAPEDLERILQKRTMQELLDNYLEVDAMYLRETLQEAQSLTPLPSDGGNTLTYRATVRQPLVLVRRDGRWYIRN